MSKNEDITNLVERMEPLEEKLGVTIEGLYASFADDPFIRVNGELHTTNGLELAEDLNLVMIVYDSQGRVLDTSSDYFGSENFQMFEVFSMLVDTHGNKPARIRLYPKKA